MQIRPLGELSRIVREDMPSALARREFRRLLWRIDEASSWISDENLHSLRATDEWPVALLDLSMIDAAIVHGGPKGAAEPPLYPLRFSNLLSRVFTTEETPEIKYGQLVLDNPPTDLRTFSQGDVGVTEGLFYTSHRKIEDVLSVAIEEVKLQLEYLSGKSVPRKLLTSEELSHLLFPLVDSFEGAGLKGMPEGHFDSFRKYFGKVEPLGRFGASGAFSAQKPILEVLTRNGAPTSEFRKNLEKYWSCLPRQHKPELRAAIEGADKGNTLVAFLSSPLATEETVDYVYVLELFFYLFRKKHLEAVERQMPDKPIGTAGFPRAFLEDRIGPEPVRRTLVRL